MSAAGRAIVLQGFAGTGRSSLLAAAARQVSPAVFVSCRDDHRHPLAALCAAVGAGGPVLLAVDDVDRADAATTRWLCSLVENIAAHPVLLLMSAPVNGYDAATQHLLGAPQVERVQLRDHTRPALEALCGEAASRDAVDALLAATAGTPALVARVLGKGAALPADWRPEDLSAFELRAIADWLARHLGGAESPATRLANAAAALGMRFDCTGAASVAGLTPGEVQEAIMVLFGRGLFAGTVAQARFRQPVVRLALRPRQRQDAQRPRSALTASERRVAELAPAGRTNRDIARELWVTVKTVELHLTSTYRKLGIRSRRELPPAFAA